VCVRRSVAGYCSAEGDSSLNVLPLRKAYSALGRQYIHLFNCFRIRAVELTV
jgi:hypothetical protein